MAGRMRGMPPELEEHYRTRLTLLQQQARLAEEEVALEVLEATRAGLSTRRIAPWLEVSFNTVARLKVRGIAIRNRRSRTAVEQGGEQREVS